MTRLTGDFRPPGDKSISHRVLILAGLSRGTSILSGLNPGKDCRSTRQVLSHLGAVFRDEAEEVLVTGTDASLREPACVLDCGNSGTTLRLMTGVLAASPGLFLLAGDASLTKRPMRRVAEPLEAMGAMIWTRSDGTAPVAVMGRKLLPVRHTMTLASAQVKSAVLLAGALSMGTTAVREPVATRDHTERLLRHFGGNVRVENETIEVPGLARLEGRPVSVPGDISAAAFALVAAAMVEGSEVTARGVGINPTRRGVLDMLKNMGAEVIEDPLPEAGRPEPAADVTVRFSELRAVTIEGAATAGVIDELPVLAVAACLATGTTTVRDAGELRIKESDRIAGIVAGLKTLGAAIEEQDDGFVIEGGGAGFRFAGGVVDALDDHRLAMAFRVASLAARGPVTIKGGECVAISDPGFEATLAGLLRS